MKNSKTGIMVECALMIAMATVLGYIPVFEMPMGGSITLCSMVPLVVISFRHGVKWGVLTGAVHGVIQMILGIKNVMYCTTFWSMTGCILLDYVFAFAVMGTACVFGSGMKNSSAKIVVGTATAGLLRLFCSFLSGILIWGGYAPEGQPVWIYSLTYNAGFMLPEIFLTLVAAVAVIKMLEKRFPAAL